MKIENKIDYLICLVLLVVLINSFLIHQIYAYKKDFDYNPIPTLEQERYNREHPVIKEIKPYFNNCSNIKLRRYIINGCVYYGELNGKGRPVFTHAGIKDCPNCKKSILELLKVSK